MATKEQFDDFARRWLMPRKDELAGYMIDAILRGPMRRVPRKFRKVAAALRTLRGGQKDRIIRAVTRRAVKKGRRK